MRSNTSCSGWIVARTKPQRETYAEDNIKRQGYEPLLLRCVDEDTGRTGVLFPGYIFVFAPERWQWLRSTYGVLDVVLGTGGLPARMPDAELHELQARANSQGLVPVRPSGKFVEGQRVRFTDGPFWGRVGLYQETAANRVFILLELLGRTVRVGVPGRVVEVA